MHAVTSRQDGEVKYQWECTEGRGWGLVEAGSGNVRGLPRHLGPVELALGVTASAILHVAAPGQGSAVDIGPL
eukprot:4404964-Pyramimonas_sp.AAC.1